MAPNLLISHLIYITPKQLRPSNKIKILEKHYLIKIKSFLALMHIERRKTYFNDILLMFKSTGFWNFLGFKVENTLLPDLIDLDYN